MDDKIKTIGQIMLDPAMYGTPVTASPERSTDDLDLTTLPERLDDETLDRVKAIARSPLPPEPAATERHFTQCLRIMLAVLPKRSADDVTGELFVAAYQRKLGHYSEPAISFLADKAMERCQWFPTIHECIEILTGYRRSDAAVRRVMEARRIKYEEEQAREKERSAAIAEQREWAREHGHFGLTQEDVDAMSQSMINIGLGCKALREDESGKVRPWFRKPGESEW